MNQESNLTHIEKSIQEFNQALDDEIAAIRSSGGKKTHVSDGRFLGKRHETFVYSFTADTELRFPDETPVDLEFKGKKQSGLVISVDNFDLILALHEFIGESVPTAILYTAPWFLLEELKKRLTEITCYQEVNLDLLYQVLTQAKQFYPGDGKRAELLLTAIEKNSAIPLNYNQHQLRAIANVLANPISFIWGPPGTGKTQTLGLTAAALLQAGESVLIVAHSNIAVDVAMLSVIKNLSASALYRDGLILRYGFSYLPELENYPLLQGRGVLKMQNPRLIERIEKFEAEKRSLIKRSRFDRLPAKEKEDVKNDLELVKRALQPLNEEIKQKESELVRSARLVGCTLSKASIAPDIFQRSFSAVLVDESSMAYIPHCAYVSSLAKKRIAFFGDFRQLAPISQADTPLADIWLKKDIFDQSGIIDMLNERLEDKRLVLLATQYRMHPAIAAIPNELFYENLLQNGPEVEKQANPIVAAGPGEGEPLLFCDISRLSAYCYSDKESNSRFNLVSALLAVQMAYAITQSTTNQVGIVTPYNAQARLINRLLRDLKLPKEKASVATVHRFQGSESDMIVFDSVEGPPKNRAGKIVTGVKNSTAMRLANVAISRAKGKFIVLCNYDYLKTRLHSADSFRQLIDLVAANSRVDDLQWKRLIDDEFGSGIVPGLRLFSSGGCAQKHVENDLSKAKEEIVITWPGDLLGHHFSPAVLKQVDSGRVRFFITGNGSDSFFRIGLKNAQIWVGGSHNAMGIIGIDRKRLWVYLDPDLPDSPVLNLCFSQTSKLLYSFWRLVPEDERRATIEEKIEKGRGPVGLPCPQCAQALWPRLGKYGPYLACISCRYTKRITEKDATDLARVSGLVCPDCGGQVKGKKGYKGVFLGCHNYPECNWTRSLENLV